MCVLVKRVLCDWFVRIRFLVGSVRQCVVIDSEGGAPCIKDMVKYYQNMCFSPHDHTHSSVSLHNRLFPFPIFHESITRQHRSVKVNVLQKDERERFNKNARGGTEKLIGLQLLPDVPPCTFCPNIPSSFIERRTGHVGTGAQKQQDELQRSFKARLGSNADTAPAG